MNYPGRKNWHFLGTLLLAIALLVSAVPASGGGRALLDSAINDAVEDEVAKDKRIVLHEIDVQTESGVVKLSGTVDNILVKERAALRRSRRPSKTAGSWVLIRWTA